ncbi:hypothetical protein T484DRAFT_1909446 [Baffinella frigidus]|nr:hypothetical protein T484DRAFT_1909446 [Cryptophyta sp. CCMP2293]|mmetsp:Transcript_59933/g.136969  ORF Transcript_59933/g.136969 Transcript_59933/m.136969 type:complete len:133 (+) Transcript_59933:45-443(+)
MYATKCLAALAFIASAAAYGTNAVVGPSVVSKAAVTKPWRPPLAASPLTRDDAFNEPTTNNNFAKRPIMKAKETAPLITFFDARGGCSRGGSEYQGAKSSNSDDDKMCVKLQMTKIVAGNAEAVLQGLLGQI